MPEKICGMRIASIKFSALERYDISHFTCFHNKHVSGKRHARWDSLLYVSKMFYNQSLDQPLWIESFAQQLVAQGRRRRYE